MFFFIGLSLKNNLDSSIQADKGLAFDMKFEISRLYYLHELFHVSEELYYAYIFFNIKERDFN